MRALILPTLLLSLPVSLAAQQSVASYWRELAAASSLEEIHAIGAPPQADAVVTDGLLRLRRYELSGDRTEAMVARSTLERAAPTGTAWTHFALGVALARGPDVRVVVGDGPDDYFVDPHSNAARQAPRTLKRALELEPGLHEAAYVLAELALDLGDRPLMRDALRALAHPERQRQARAQQLRARLLAALDELAGAAQAADAAAALGTDRSVAAHLKAAALLRRRGSAAEAARVYFEGVELLTAESAEVYFRALAPVVTPGELRRWQAADLPGKREWLRRFWEVQAALAGVPVEQRLAIHFLRLADVQKNGRVGPMGSSGASAGRELASMGDLRGFGIGGLSELLWIRHGDSLRAQRVRYCGEEVLDVPLPLAPTPKQCAATPASRMREGVHPGSILARRAAEAAAPGTTHYPPFSTHLTLVHEMLQFRGPVGRTTLVASVAVPASSARELVQDGVLTARFDLSLIDTATASVTRQDAIRRFDVAQLPEDGWVLLSSELSMPQAQLYRIGIMDTARTAGRVVGGTIAVRPYDSGELLLSDVLATPEDGVPSFARGDVRLSLAPGREFGRDESFTLYYEVYGLADAAAYSTEILIEPKAEGISQRVRSLFPGARESVRLTFSEAVEGAHPIYGVQQMRSVGLGGLLPGGYELTITVRDAAGRVATRRRALDVVEPQ